MSNEHTTETGETDAVDPKKLSLVGGFVGTVVGARRGLSGAVTGGFLGGTLGYLTGASMDDELPPVTDADTEPVAIDVSDPDEEDES